MVVSDQTDSMFQGERHTIHFALTDGAGDFDLTGMSARFRLARIDDDGTVATHSVVEKTSASAAEIEIDGDPTTGELDVKLIGADTADFSGDFHFELAVIDDQDEAEIVATGTLTINPAIES